MIRELRKTDVEYVAKIWLDTNIKAHDFIPEEYWKSNFAFVKEMFLQAEIYLYEEEKARQILGFVGLNDNYIEGIFVRDKAQSCGIGRKLLDFVKERKCSLKLSVYQKNARAIQFYEREGLQMVSEGVDEVTGEKEYVMVWERLSYSNIIG